MKRDQCRLEVRGNLGKVLYVESFSPRGWTDALGRAEKQALKEHKAGRYTDVSVAVVCGSRDTSWRGITLVTCKKRTCTAYGAVTDDRRSLAGRRTRRKR